MEQRELRSQESQSQALLWEGRAAKEPRSHSQGIVIYKCAPVCFACNKVKLEGFNFFLTAGIMHIGYRKIRKYNIIKNRK